MEQSLVYWATVLRIAIEKGDKGLSQKAVQELEKSIVSTEGGNNA